MKQASDVKSDNSSTARNSPGSNADSDKPVQDAQDTAGTSKPKRVRTGCLTCRERHLKCDEAMPICQNCRKSNRECKRGVRLNFIDTQTKEPPYLVPPTQDYQIGFQDDSRNIASEYKGGLGKYASQKTEETFEMGAAVGYEYNPEPIGAPQMSHQPLPSIDGILPNYANNASTSYQEQNNTVYMNGDHSASNSNYSDSISNTQTQSYEQNTQTAMMTEQPEESHPFLDNPDEVLYMQVFVEEVGLWMDSMDADKTFSRILPFHALRQPMLKYAFLACGARHLTLVNAAYPEEKALSYYNTATQLLLRSLQNPERDSALCATTAVILNVYEIMSEKALQRMNHIAGARALIKECGWNAKSQGIGGACFWLNVGLEVHSCLHFNWAVAWEPDDWGFDMTMVPSNAPGDEETWTHRVLYIIAKVANFRSQIPRFQEASPHAEQMRLNRRIQIWMHLKDLTDRWHQCIPDNMHPMAYVSPFHTASKSTFPEVWIIKRTTIVARLFYHTAMTLLGGMHPAASMDANLANEMHDMKVYHSRQICGIVAHVKDRGVASASIRCLAAAAESLTVRREQEEVLEIFDKIKKETGWRVEFLRSELTDKWGWNDDSAQNKQSQQQPQQQQQQMPTPHHSQQSPMNSATGGLSNGQSAFFQQGTTATMPPIPAHPPPQSSSRPKIPTGIVNPLYATADFSKPQHPYQQYYVAPNANSLHDTSMFHFGL